MTSPALVELADSLGHAAKIMLTTGRVPRAAFGFAAGGRRLGAVFCRDLDPWSDSPLDRRRSYLEMAVLGLVLRAEEACLVGSATLERGDAEPADPGRFISKALQAITVSLPEGMDAGTPRPWDQPYWSGPSPEAGPPDWSSIPVEVGSYVSPFVIEDDGAAAFDGYVATGATPEPAVVRALGASVWGWAPKRIREMDLQVAVAALHLLGHQVHLEPFRAPWPPAGWTDPPADSAMPPAV